MQVAEPPLLTVRNYRILPETGPRYQLIEGYLYMSPAPNRYHQDISRNLEFILLSYLKKRPLGKLYHAPFDVYLDDYNVFQPDICIVLKKSWSRLSARGMEGAPEFVVEILSPKTARLDRDNKTRMYATHGVEELWIIMPDKKRIEIFHLPEDAKKPVAVIGATEVFGARSLPGLKISATDIFAE